MIPPLLMLLDWAATGTETIVVVADLQPSLVSFYAIMIKPLPLPTSEPLWRYSPDQLVRNRQAPATPALGTVQQIPSALTLAGAIEEQIDKHETNKLLVKATTLGRGSLGARTLRFTPDREALYRRQREQGLAWLESGRRREPPAPTPLGPLAQAETPHAQVGVDELGRLESERSDSGGG